jgi:hypothetical protein
MAATKAPVRGSGASFRVLVGDADASQAMMNDDVQTPKVQV